MLMFFLLVLWLVVIIGWLVLRDRIAEMESNLRWSAQHDRSELEKQMAELTTRVLKLERQEIETPAPPPATAIISQPPEKGLQWPISAPEPPPQPHPPIEREPEPAYWPASTPTPVQAATNSSDRLRKLLGGGE